MTTGRLTISRITGGSKDQISIKVSDKSSGTEFIEVRIPPEEFALALTGLGYQTCEFFLRGIDRVGLTHESKYEIITIPGLAFTSDDLLSDRVIHSAVSPYEVDGWEADLSQIGNHHYRTPEGWKVAFHRYVANEDTYEPPTFT